MLDGRVAAYGSPSEVVNRYVGVVLERQEREGGAPKKSPVRGTGIAQNNRMATAQAA